MTRTMPQISSDEIPFETISKEPRASVEDSRQLICIDVDRIGTGYRAIINGSEYELSEQIPTMEDARRVACDLAIREINKAISEIIQKVY